MCFKVGVTIDSIEVKGAVRSDPESIRRLIKHAESGPLNCRYYPAQPLCNLDTDPFNLDLNPLIYDLGPFSIDAGQGCTDIGTSCWLCPLNINFGRCSLDAGGAVLALPLPFS